MSGLLNSKRLDKLKKQESKDFVLSRMSMSKQVIIKQTPVVNLEKLILFKDMFIFVKINVSQSEICICVLCLFLLSTLFHQTSTSF